MNRDILFRGKRLDNGEWVYGYLRAFDDGSYHITTKVERNVARHIDGKPFYTLYGVEHEVYPETVGQYTGLKDKNGVRIFEGDFTYHHRHEDTAYLVWHERHICFVGKSLDENGGERYYYQKRNEPYLEVIGNIHDNPELLEVPGDE